MEAAPILIGYDDSDGSRRAIKAAAALFGKRHAVVLDVAPAITGAESLASISSVVPGTAFEELNAESALERARIGAERARRAGFEADARAELAASTWEGLVDVADEIDAAVIVIGSRDLTGPQRALDRGVSRSLAEHAGRPVLIVPQGGGQ